MSRRLTPEEVQALGELKPFEVDVRGPVSESQVQIEGTGPLENPVSQRLLQERRVREAGSDIAGALKAERLVDEDEARRLRSPATFAHNVRTGAGFGATLGAPVGGPIGAAKGAAVGALTGLAGSVISAVTEEPLLGAASEALMSPGTSVARGLGRGARALEGAFTAESRAARALQREGLLGEVLGDAEGAADVVRSGVQTLKQDRDIAYQLAREFAPDASVSPDLVRAVVGPRRYQSIVNRFDQPDAWNETTWLDWERLDRVRKSLGDDIAEASNARRYQEARDLQVRKDGLDDVFEELARRAPGGEEALAAYRGARGRNVEYRSALPGRGARPSERLLEGVAGPEADRFGRASDWFNAVVTNKKGRMTGYRQGLEAARRVGRGEEYRRNMRGALMEWLAASKQGATGAPDAVAGARKIRANMAAVDDLVDELFTPGQRAFLEENAGRLSEAMGGGTMNKKLQMRLPVLQRAWQALGFGVVGGAVAGPETGIAALAITGAADSILARIQLRYGARVADELSLRALYDEGLMEKLSRRLAPQVLDSAAKRIVESSVRRGALFMEDMAQLEPEQRPEWLQPGGFNQERP